MLTKTQRVAALAAIVLGLAAFQLAALAQKPEAKAATDAKQAPPKAEGPKSEGTKKETPKADPPKTKPDLQGDPLPEGAIARLGTTRMRHGEPVGLVKFMQDGKSLLTLAGDGFVRVWDSATGKELRRFRIIPEQNVENMMMGGGWGMVGGGMVFFRQMNLQGMAISPDGGVLSVVGYDGSLHLWDTIAGKELRKIDNIYSDGGLSEAMFTPDGKTLAVRGYDSTTRLFEVATAKKTRTIGKRPDNNNNVYYGGGGMTFSPDGKTMASTGGENANGKQLWHLYLHDVGSGNEINRITTEDQSGFPVCPTFSPDGKNLIWTDWQGTIKVAETISGKVVQEHKNSNGGYNGGEFVLSADGRTLISRGMNAGLRMVDLASGKATMKFEQPTQMNQNFGWWGGGGRGSISMSRDGKLVAMTSEGNALRVLDLAANKERDFGDGHRTGVARINHGPDGKTLVTQGQDGTICVWDCATGKKQRQFKVPNGAHHFVLSPDGKMILAAHQDNTVQLHDSTTLKSLHKLEGAKEGLGSLAFSADGKSVGVYGGADKGAYIWIYDTATGKQKQKIKLPLAAPDANGNFAIPMTSVTGLVFSPDGKLVVATIEHHTLGIWDTTTGREYPPIRAPEQKAIQGVVFSPNCRSIALDLHGEDALRLWEIASGKERRVFGKKPTPNPNGQNRGNMMWFGGGFNGNVMMPNTRPAPGAAFSADGRLLAQGRTNHSVSVWELSTGKEINQFKGHNGMVDSLSFAADCKSLASGSRDTTGLVWELSKSAPVANAKPPEVNVESKWKELAGDDAPKAFEAIWAMASVPGPAVAFLKDQVRPAAFADPNRIEELVADLDSEQFAKRKKATTELEKVGEAAATFLRKALDAEPSPEARKRIEEVLKKTDAATPRGEALRTIRAIEVLEAIGTAEAKAVLQILAKGMPEAAITRAASGALERLH
jgi:WD40 repeat protein